MTIEELSLVAERNGLAISEPQRAKLSRYGALLRETNSKVNLISRKDEENILSKHILHSLTLAMSDVTGYSIPANSKVFDIGTGGGLPGIPLKIVRDDLDMVLCDSIGKKIAAVQAMIEALGLTKISTVVERAESLAKRSDHAHRYDVVVSRAVAPLDDLMKWTQGLLKPGGTLLALKGGDLREEIERTRRMKSVADVSQRPLSLNEYDDYLTEEKKVIRVTLLQGR